MAGRDVDIADAVKFLVSCKAPYNYQENIENLCGAGRSKPVAVRAKARARADAPHRTKQRLPSNYEGSVGNEAFLCSLL